MRIGILWAMERITTLGYSTFHIPHSIFYI